MNGSINFSFCLYIRPSRPPTISLRLIEKENWIGTERLMTFCWLENLNLILSKAQPPRHPQILSYKVVLTLETGTVSTFYYYYMFKLSNKFKLMSAESHKKNSVYINGWLGFRLHLKPLIWFRFQTIISISVLSRWIFYKNVEIDNESLQPPKRLT